MGLFVCMNFYGQLLSLPSMGKIMKICPTKRTHWVWYHVRLTRCYWGFFLNNWVFKGQLAHFQENADLRIASFYSNQSKWRNLDLNCTIVIIMIPQGHKLQQRNKLIVTKYMTMCAMKLFLRPEARTSPPYDKESHFSCAFISRTLFFLIQLCGSNFLKRK